MGTLFPMPRSYSGDKFGVFEEHRPARPGAMNEGGRKQGPLGKQRITIPFASESPTAHLGSMAPKEAVHRT